MIKNAIKKLAQFSTGVAVGALAGVVVGHFTAPSSGDDLRADGRDLIASAKREGEQARVARETELRQKFRGQVGNQQALTDPIERTDLPASPTGITQPTRA